MKMVAAAKLRRAQDGVIAARPYAKKMKELLRYLAGIVDVTAHPLFTVRDIRSVAVIVVTADRGLCGAFNANIIRAASTHIRANYSELNAAGKVKLVCVGRKGFEFFVKNAYHIASKHLGIFAGLSFARAEGIVAEVVQGFEREEYDRVEIVYNEFKSIIQQRIVIDQLLPIPAFDMNPPSGAGSVPAQDPQIADHSGKAPPDKSLHRSSTGQIDYIYEPSSEEIISALVPKHLNFQLWRVLLESNAAEQGARMTAMDNATTNASDLIRSLQLSYNKARQASITKELLEIVSGAEALKSAG